MKYDNDKSATHDGEMNYSNGHIHGFWNTTIYDVKLKHENNTKLKVIPGHWFD